MRVPVQWFKIVHREQSYLDSLEEVIPYIKEELNCENVLLELEDIRTVKLSCLPNNPVLGGRLGKGFDKNLRTAIMNLDHDAIMQYEKEQKLSLSIDLGPGELIIKRKYCVEDETLESGGNDDVIVVMNAHLTEGLIEVGVARDFVFKVQQLRKTSGLQISDRVELFIGDTTEYFGRVLGNQAELIRNILKIPVREVTEVAEGQKLVAEDVMEKDADRVRFSLYWVNN